MDSKKNTASKKIYIIFITLAVFAVLFAFLSTRSNLRTFLSTNQIQSRQILAKIFAEFSKQKFVIFKIKTESGIDIEIFEKDAENNQRLKQKFSLTDDTEAFLMINNNSVNLGLTDVDHDGISDIIAPTVDRNGNSRLNIFKYNSDLNQFVPAQAQD
jgi:hypothetical protein